MIQDEIECHWFPGKKRPPCTILHFRFEASTAKRAQNAPVGKKGRLRAAFLGTRTPGARDHRQRERLLGVERGGELMVELRHSAAVRETVTDRADSCQPWHFGPATRFVALALGTSRSI